MNLRLSVTVVVERDGDELIWICVYLQIQKRRLLFKKINIQQEMTIV